MLVLYKHEKQGMLGPRMTPISRIIKTLVQVESFARSGFVRKVVD